MTERKKVLIINCCHTSNFGDQAIGITMKELFEDKGCIVDLFDIIRVDGAFDSEQFYNGELKDKINPLYNLTPTFKQRIYSCLRNLLNNSRWKRKNLPKIKTICKNRYDVMVIGGGELVQSNGIFPVAISTWVKSINQYSPKTKVVFFGVGVTGDYTLIDKCRMAKAIKRSDEFFVRDYSSLENLSNVFKRSAELIPDVVMGSYQKKRPQTDDGNIILYGITSFSRLKRYKYKGYETRCDYYEDCYNDMLDAGYLKSIDNLRLLYSDTQDYCECHAFAKYVQKHYQKEIAVCSFKTLEGFESEIAKSKVVISPRMHACIFGLIYKKEVRPICISKKTQAFYDEYMCIPQSAEAFRETLSNAVDSAICTNGVEQ